MAFDGYRSAEEFDQQPWFSRAIISSDQFSGSSIPPPAPAPPPPPPNPNIAYSQQYPPYGNTYQPDIRQNALTPQHSPAPPSPHPPNANPNIPGSFPPDTAVGYELQRNGPGNDAAKTTAGNGDPSLNPELVAEITSAVIQHLKGVNLDAHSQGQHQSFHARPSAPVASQSFRHPPEQNRYNLPAITSVQGYTSFSLDKHLGDVQHTPIREEPNNYLWGSARPPPMSDPDPDEVRDQLFKKNGEPTANMSAVMWGIGHHLSQDTWRDKHSLNGSTFITPDKLLEYYEDVKLSQDTYPWRNIFGQRAAVISQLYCEVGAEHILVQARANETPTIPALTRDGFERWMSLLIKSNPAQEYARIHRSVWQLPILQIRERLRWFPHEMPTITFPEPVDPSAREILENALSKHCHINFYKPPAKMMVTTESPEAPHQTATPRRGGLFGGTAPITNVSIPPPPLPSSSYSLPGFGQPHNQNRGPLFGIDEPPQTYSVQREAQSYPAQPGEGKMYGDSQEIEVINTPTSVHLDDFDHQYHHSRRRKQQRQSREFGSGAGGKASPAVGMEGYDDSNDSHRSQGNRNPETEFHGRHRKDGSRVGSYAVASGGHRSHSHRFSEEYEEYDDGDDNYLRYIEKDKGERRSYERSREGDRERDRDTRRGSDRDVDGNKRRQKSAHHYGGKERYPDDSSRGGWTEGEEYYKDGGMRVEDDRGITRRVTREGFSTQ